MNTPYRFFFGRKIMLLFFLLGLFANNTYAQKTSKCIGKKVLTNYEAELKSIFLDFDVYQINSNQIANAVRATSGNPIMLNLELGNEYDWRILMYENDLLNDNYSLTNRTDNGDVVKTRGNIKTLSGHLQADQGGKAYLTINDHFILGMVHHGNQSYFIEPLNGILPNASKDLFVIYNIKDAIPDANVSCGVTELNKHQLQPAQVQPNFSRQMDVCAEVELALAADRAMFDKYQTIEGVENYLVGIWNLVAPDYIGWFSQDIEFNIVNIFVVSGQDPWTNSTEVITLLNEFRSWGNNNGFSTNFDLGQLWTARDLTNEQSNTVVGLGYIGVVCTNSRYSTVEDFSNNSSSMRQTVAHEVGHNFAATHDDGNGFIMSPAVNSSSTWSANSISVISSHINSRACFEPCLQCLDVTSFDTKNCGGGTYDLEVCIEHVGRTATSVLQIEANGTIANFDFNDTGAQCVTLGGLIADATKNASLTIQDTNDIDTECTMSTEYIVPHPDCTCSDLFSENFDALMLPEGWSNVGTGNNSNGIWDFGTTTFGLNSVAGSFNGSGMAFWDDDANGSTGNGSEFMELTTPVIDLTNFELVTLDFDYNFWTFNGLDAFRVDVWNGTTWVNILSTNETDCGAWGCDFPHFAAVMDDYINPDFRIRYTYDDADNSWQWYVAIDNVALCGFPRAAALPIDLVEFNGKDNDCTVELDWTIADENTKDIFNIERSFDGQTFEVIGSINGVSSNNQSFQFTDTNPGYENLYRLKTIAPSGKVDYSTLISVTATSCKEGVVDIVDIYPNPTNGALNYTIHANDATKVIIEIRNAAGMLVNQFDIELIVGMNSYSLDTKHLAVGMYYMQMVNEDGSSRVRKFVRE